MADERKRAHPVPGDEIRAHERMVRVVTSVEPNRAGTGHVVRFDQVWDDGSVDHYAWGLGAWRRWHKAPFPSGAYQPGQENPPESA